ncbi:MAG: winged helix DNA-binding domain-containing protein, partial [Erysipelotrichaceae bacterium]|nr:winged helix DNA-binding domain-containing protein [Erysipelotrichaceae bacterium]
EGNPTRASRSVLEQLYTTGELVIHHKEKTRKFYDLAERRLPLSLLEQKDPFPDDFEHIKWRILRRISAVGLLWERNSPAFLGISNLNTEKRKEAFDQLRQEEKITVVEIEGIRYPFYICQQDRKLLEAAKEEGKSSRLEFLAPLDPMLWDRDLIKAVFGFDYSWEIYIPKEKRRYGYYVLPILYGQRFIGRMEPILKDGKLEVKGFWLEKGVRKSKKLNRALNARLKRFAKFNGVVYEDEDLMEKVKR